MQASVLSVRVDSRVKESFTSLCEELGITASVAVNMFIRQMVREQALPFTPAVSLPKNAPEQHEKSRAILSFHDISLAVERIASEIPEIARVMLFGSYSRGEATPQSDVDLRIEWTEGATLGLLALSGLASRLESDLKRRVDLVTAEKLDKELEAAIKQEGMVVYERKESR